jgi:hypothetical protein
MSERQIVSKTDFARLKNVSPARVSQWISGGKIDGKALVGEGRNARVDVEIASEQLRSRLDLSQSVGNGLGTRLDTAQVPPDLLRQGADAAPATAPRDSSIEEQFKRERLEGERRKNRREAEEEAARAGRFVDSQAMRVEVAKVAGRVVSVIDGGLPEMASAIAAKFSLPQRDVLHILRTEFRNVRQRAANGLRTSAAAAPALVEAELADETDIEVEAA